MKQKFLSFVKLFFFLGIGLLLVWLVVKDLSVKDKEDIFSAFKSADYFWVFVTLVLSFLSNVSRAIRWKMLMQPMGYEPKLSNTFLALTIGYMANYALPRMGEVTRCGILNKYEKIPVNESLGTVVAERALDLVFLVLIFVFTLFTQFDLIYNYSETKVLIPLTQKFSAILSNTIGMLVMSVLIVFIGSLVYYFRKKISQVSLLSKVKDLFVGFAAGLQSVKNIKKPFLFIAHSVFIWVMYFLMIYLGFFAFSQTSDLSTDAAFSILVFGTLGMIATQGGIGAYPLLVMETLGLYKISLTIGFAFGWMAWTAQAILVVALGLISLILIPVLNREKKYATARIPEVQNS